MKTVYLGLGSNLNRREENLRSALQQLDGGRVRVMRTSAVYETRPMYVEDQPSFLNMVAECETDMFPRMLLGRLMRIEKALGRERTIRNGPRVIDIDILMFGKFVIDAPELQVPHPRLHERRFALEPLVELAPDLRHPVARKSVRELLSLLPAQGVRKLDLRIEWKK
jgi:2-amino-4-hydroxy-6-hydroxymethyldihydropteridine diphosphokinase